jgi:hypothetical protein
MRIESETKGSLFLFDENNRFKHYELVSSTANEDFIELLFVNVKQNTDTITLDGTLVGGKLALSSYLASDGVFWFLRSGEIDDNRKNIIQMIEDGL